MSEIRVDTIKAEDGISAPTFPSGVSVTGVITATTLQQSVSGEFTAGSLKVGSNIQVGNAGVVTATTFSGAHSGSGANLTSIPANQLASGTIPDARFPSTLPAVSGANLTGITQAVKKIYTRRDGARYSVNNQVQGNSYASMWNWAYMQQDITPQSSTSQFHITGSLNIHHYSSYEGFVCVTYQVSGGSETAVVSNSQTNIRRTHRGNASGDGGSDMMSPVPLDLIIAPATTNQINFRLRLGTYAGGYPWFVNRDGNNTTNNSDGGGVLSSWTITELDGAQVTTQNNQIYIGT